MKTAVEQLIAKYNKQWNKYGMGSVVAYSKVVADLEKLKEMEKEKMHAEYMRGWKDGLTKQQEQ
jgi:ribosomal protein S24E